MERVKPNHAALRPSSLAGSEVTGRIVAFSVSARLLSQTQAARHVPEAISGVRQVGRSDVLRDAVTTLVGVPSRQTPFASRSPPVLDLLEHLSSKIGRQDRQVGPID